MTTAAEVTLAQAAERLRQERETFDQAKNHDARWFKVRLAIGWVAVVTLPAILIVAASIIWMHEQFDAATVRIATGALLVDALGTAASLYKLVLGDQPKRALSPVTNAPRGLPRNRAGARDQTEHQS
jgi:hypothetical protein